jgi:hypothetical protein
MGHKYLRRQAVVSDLMQYGDIDAPTNHINKRVTCIACNLFPIYCIDKCTLGLSDNIETEVQVFDLANNVSARAYNYHTLDHDMEVIVVCVLHHVYVSLESLSMIRHWDFSIAQ